MKSDDVKFYITVAGIGVGVYLLYQFWQKFKTGVGSVTCAPVTALANWYVSLTSCGISIPTGMVLLPNGQAIAVANIPGGVSSVSGSNSATFVYGGTRYYLNSPSDSNGNWAASLTLG